MIKRLSFVSRRRGLSASAFDAAWVEAVGLARKAPEGARPARLAANTTVHELVDSPLHDAIAVAWFVDLPTLERFEAWWNAASSMTDLVEPTASLRIIAEEAVMRGVDWLERRWLSPAVKLKHMALARRAPGSSPAEFAQRWRNRSGRLGGATSPLLAIPEPARGRAYVQNHPLIREGVTGEWAYDAINEVYFDDLESMQPRLEFFRQHDVLQADADLVSKADFLVVREAWM